MRTVDAVNNVFYGCFSTEIYVYALLTLRAVGLLNNSADCTAVQGVAEMTMGDTF